MKAKMMRIVLIGALGMSMLAVVRAAPVVKPQANREVSARSKAAINDENLRCKVKNEVERQVFFEKRNAIKNIVYGKKDNLLKQPSLTYKSPRWPFYTQFYEQRDLFQFEFQGSGASQAYFPNGSQDLSALVLGEKCITVKDVLLVSKLAQKDFIEGRPSDVAIFKAIADQPLVFDASTWELAGYFNFARHFRRGQLSLNVQFPVVFKHNQICLTNEYTEAIRSQVAVQTDSKFSTMTLHELYSAILEENGLSTVSKSTQSALGDIVASVYYQVPTERVERFILGLKVTFPTSPSAACRNKLWQAEIGNGGFTQLGGFLSLLHHRNRFLNVHVHASVTGSFAAHECRRVPRKITVDNSAACPTGCEPLTSVPFGGNFMLVENVTFNELETSCLRGFGKETHRFIIRPGVEGTIQIGNMFERCFMDGGFFDLFYALRIKGKGHIHSACNDLSVHVEPSVWVRHSDVIEHKIGGDWSYQFNNTSRFALGASYVFAGHHVAKTIEGHLNLNLEF